MSSILSEEDKQTFERDGYLILRGFSTVEETRKVLERSRELLRQFSLTDHPMTKFVGTKGEGGDHEQKHVGDDYFLTSGDKVRFFFEPAAFDPVTGRLNRPKEESVNKIGHGLAVRDRVFKEFTFSDKLKQLAVELEFHRDPRVLQSMVICKNARVGGEVTSHDDSTFLFTDPPSAIGFWFALEDSTTENGCLSFVPGSHKLNKVDKRLVRVPGGGTELVKVEGVEPCGIDWDDERPGVEWLTAECRAGDLVLIHGTVVHRSERNLSDKSRFIYTFHCVESSREGVEWDEKNWLQTPGKEFPSLLRTDPNEPVEEE